MWNINIFDQLTGKNATPIHKEKHYATHMYIYYTFNIYVYVDSNETIFSLDVLYETSLFVYHTENLLENSLVLVSSEI